MNMSDPARAWAVLAKHKAKNALATHLETCEACLTASLAVEIDPTAFCNTGRELLDAAADDKEVV